MSVCLCIYVCTGVCICGYEGMRKRARRVRTQEDVLCYESIQLHQKPILEGSNPAGWPQESCWSCLSYLWY